MEKTTAISESNQTLEEFKGAQEGSNKFVAGEIKVIKGKIK